MVVVGIPGFNKQIFVLTSQFPGYSKHLWLTTGCSLYPSLIVAAKALRFKLFFVKVLSK